MIKISKIYIRLRALFQSSNHLIILSSLLLASCGFSPLYEQTPRAVQSGTLSGISVETIPGRNGQLLKMNLEDRLNPSGATVTRPTYRLSTSLKESRTPVGIARDGTVSRYNIFFDANYTLTRISDSQAVATGTVRQVSSFNNIVGGAYFSTYVSEQDAVKRGITELSEALRQRLGTHIGTL